ncbi:restriction endonuclease [Photobacterium damselae]|uniref:restriction endonuclease n=1 Tax=Photobacterium damselae TaxID=38293 RepID=UPI0010FF4339|nr:restriction endonuclease [Photobacterium damselae]TLS80662.1 restriction endonuclease [Photobacterium damselae subsp. damselae]
MSKALKRVSMAYLEIYDSSSLNQKKSLAIGLSHGDFNVGDEIYIVSKSDILKGKLYLIKINDVVNNSCSYGEYVCFIVNMKESWVLNFSKYKKHINEFNEVYYQAYVTNKLSEIELLKGKILEPEDIIQNVRDEIKNTFNLYENILTRKYNQLSYVDEYDELNITRFEKEAKRFISSKLGYTNDKLMFASLYLIELVNSVDLNAVNDDFKKIKSPYEYEDFCANLLNKNGWKIIPTAKSGDQGADVLAEKDDIRIVIQCKMYNNPVGNKSVQEVYSAKGFYEADLAFVVTNSTYTKSAQTLAGSLNILLLHHDDLSAIK